MKILKKKFRKIKKPKIALKKIIIKPKLGCWCEYYKGRLPSPTECQSNKHTPIGIYVKNGETVQTYDRSACLKCKRSVEFLPWRKGDWNKIKEAIKNGEDLTDMDKPFK